MIGRVISHYRILEKIGEGGMGVVYVAEDILLGRRVAIKSLTVAAEPGKQHFRTRFLREARAVSALSHPHIATVYDYGETPEGRPFIVMELVKGKTLNDLLHDNALTLMRAVELIGDVAEALKEAHRHGIIHRDIKPSNVAINDRGEVKVLDFGLAKQINTGDLRPADPELQTLLNTQTREGVVVGTPMYLSPEQAMGLPVDERSDLFSLGALLYECIAGRPAFSGSSPVEICAQVIRDDPPPPSHFNPRVPPELDSITLKALAKKTDARYQSADELISDLNAVQPLLQEPSIGQATTQRITHALNAGRTSALSTLSDIFKRPRLSIGYVLIGLLVVGLIAGALWGMFRPKLRQPSAEAQRLFELGTNALREGAYYKASNLLTRAVEADDKFALAHARLAEAWMELDYTDKSKDELLIVTDKLVPDRSVLPQAIALYLNAITATVTRDLERAIKSYTEMARLKPDDAHAYVDLGRAYEKNDEIEKAIENYRTAAKLDSNNVAALVRMGILYGRKQSWRFAEEVFDMAFKLYQEQSNFEGMAEVIYQRGYIYEQSGRGSKAREQLQEALKITQINNNKYQQIRTLLGLSRVACSEGDTAQARKYATEAVELAKTGGMENLTTQGLHDLGYAFLTRRAYDDAEQYFKQALDFAQRFKGRNNEAKVMLSLGSMYIQQEEADKGLPYIEQAFAYYNNGGYRKEAAKCLLKLGRARLLKGDYDAALKTFETQLKLAKQVDDPEQVASSHAEIGSALAKQELYPQALYHFNESYPLYEGLGNPFRVAFNQLNRSDMLAYLGHHDRARSFLDELNPFLERLSTDNNYKQVWSAWAYLIRARMELSEQNFDEVKSNCKQAMAIIQPQNKNTLAEAKSLFGLAQTFSGERSEGRKLCEDALAIVAQSSDMRATSVMTLALAESLLEGGDAKNALSAARRAQESSAQLHRQESEWRAWLIAARASKLLGDQQAMREQAAQARKLLAELQGRWGTDAFDTYLSRKDIKRYREQLDEISALS